MPVVCLEHTLMLRFSIIRWCLLASAVAGLAGFSAGVCDAGEPAPVLVRAVPVVRTAVAATRTFVGTVEPARRSVIGSPVAGRVRTVFAEEGDAIDPDDEGGGRIVEIDPRLVQIQLAAAVADRDAAFHELDELRKGPRQIVIDRLRAEVQRAQIRFEREDRRLQRLEKLFARDSAGRSELDEVRAAAQAAEQTKVIAELLHHEALQGTRPEKIAQAEARLARAQEEVRRYETLLDDHTICAPFRGYVVSRTTEAGVWIRQGDPVAEIIEVDPVEIRVAVPESVIASVHRSESVSVQIPAAATDDNAAGDFSGTVHRIVPSADSRTRSFPVRIRLANRFVEGLPVIRPGMMAHIILPVGELNDVLLVPRDALILDGLSGAATSIFVVEFQENRAVARRIPVRTGRTHSDLVEVRPPDEGQRLSEGMLVITEGNERLQSGQTIRIAEEPVRG